MRPAGGHPHFECGIASRALPGESETGDLGIIEPIPDGLLIAVVDGLGHGKKAARVARAAVETITSHARDSVIDIVRHCHDQLRQTRGAVMSVAQFNSRKETVTWLSVGNVEGLLVRNDPLTAPPHNTAIIQRGGVVGYRLPPLQTSSLPLKQGDTIVITTDGITRGFEQALDTRLSAQDMAESICRQYAKGTDDALALVTRYVRTDRE